MHKPSPAMIVALAALFVALSGVGVAATGGNFILGQSNTTSSRTALGATTPEAALAVSNTGTGIPLNLVGPSGVAPLRVGSSVNVPNLNASFLQGKRASAFLASDGSNITMFDSYDTQVHIAPGEAKDSYATCPRNGTALSGGYFLSSDSGDSTSMVPVVTWDGLSLTNNLVPERPTTWWVEAVNKGATGFSLMVEVVCAR
jgi:hypothetical protein